MKTQRLILRRRSALVVCVSNEGYAASLEARKIYRALPDKEAAAEQLLRVVDESGEDYLYPASMFRRITLTESLRSALGLGSRASR